MQALERVSSYDDWITFVMLISFFLLASLKFINQDRFRNLLLFNRGKGYVESELSENTSFFSLFGIVFTLFSVLSFSFFILKTTSVYITAIDFSFSNFLLLCLGVLVFQLIQYFIQSGIRALFSIHPKSIEVLLVSQRSYLYSISVFVFLINMLLSFAYLRPNYLIHVTLFVLLMGMVYFINTNKKLILSKLFYFILYLCAFKLAPLVVLFKLIL